MKREFKAVPDEELTLTVNRILQAHSIATDEIAIKIKNGYLYLEGKVDFPSQREAIGRTLMRSNIRGLHGICNLIKSRFN